MKNILRIAALCALNALFCALGTTAQAQSTPIPTPHPSEIYPAVTLTGDSVKVDLRSFTEALGAQDTLRVSILNERYQSYVDLGAIFANLCHVATLSNSQVVVDTCSADIPRQVAQWSTFLKGLLSASTIDAKSYVSQWTKELEPLESTKHYLVDGGKTVID